MTKRLLQVALLSLFLILSGCGYQFQGGGSILPDDVKTVAIPLAQNKTTLPGLDLQFTEELRTRFERYGVVDVLEKTDGADAVLSASINKVEFQVRDVTGTTDIELKQEIVLSIAAELKRKSGQVLWRDRNLRISEIYSTTSDTVVTSSAGFAQAGISGDSLASLGSREVTRGAQGAAVEQALIEASRRIYLDAVAADF